MYCCIEYSKPVDGSMKLFPKPFFLYYEFSSSTVTHSWAAPWGARVEVEWLIISSGDGMPSCCVQVTMVGLTYCLGSLVTWSLHLTLHLTGCEDWTGGVHQPAADWAQIVSTALPGAFSQGVVLACKPFFFLSLLSKLAPSFLKRPLTLTEANVPWTWSLTLTPKLLVKLVL